MAKIKANEALVRALQAWDIDHLYGIPGDSIDAVPSPTPFGLGLGPD